jgi:hypothetical protein
LLDEIKLDDQSGADWETIVDSGCHEHSEYCKNQVSKGDQPKLDDFVRDQMTGPEMKEYDKNFCRFCPFERKTNFENMICRFCFKYFACHHYGRSIGKYLSIL